MKKFFTSLFAAVKDNYVGEKRKAHEALMTASTQKEYDEALKNTKDMFEK